MFFWDVPFDGLRERNFFLPIRKEPMEGRLSSPEICRANLRYLKKSMEGFF